MCIITEFFFYRQYAHRLHFQYSHTNRGLKRVKQDVNRTNDQLKRKRVYRYMYMYYVCIFCIYLEMLAADVLYCPHPTNRTKKIPTRTRILCSHAG